MLMCLGFEHLLLCFIQNVVLRKYCQYMSSAYTEAAPGVMK